MTESILIVLSSIYIGYSLVVIAKVDKRLNREPSARWVYDPTEKADISPKTIEILKSAKESIYVISRYTPDNVKLIEQKHRNEYFDAIEGRIKEFLNEKGKNFDYKRIVQSGELSPVKDGMLQKKAIKDTTILEHCRKILTLLKSAEESENHTEGNRNTRSHNVKVEFYVSKPIPSFPNMILVDKRFALISLGYWEHQENRLEAEAELVNAGFILIENREENRNQFTTFSRMFDNFKDHLSISFKQVESESTV
jgi:hypothetical protein